MSDESGCLTGDFVQPEVIAERRGNLRVDVSSPAAGPMLGQNSSFAEQGASSSKALKPAEPGRHQRTLPLDAILLDAPGQPSIPIKVSNVSCGGIGFYGRENWGKGLRFVIHFRFVNAPDRLALCELRYCQPLTGGWYQGGAEFLDALTVRTPHTVIPAAWRDLPGKSAR